MDRASWARAGAIVVLFVLIGAFGLALSPTGPRASINHAPGPAAPSPISTLARATPFPPPPAIVATITITSSFSGSNDLPITLHYTISVTNAPINSGNTSVWIAIWSGSALISNLSEPVASGGTMYAVPVGYAQLTFDNYNGGNLPSTAYSFIGWITANNTTAAGQKAVTAHSATVTATLVITNVAVDFTTTVATYEASNFQLNFSVGLTGNSGLVADTSNLSFHFAVTYPTSLRTNYLFNYTLTLRGANCPGGTPPIPTCVTLNTIVMPFSGFYLYTLWVTATNSVDPAQQVRIAGATGHVGIAVGLPSATFLSPAGGAVETVGNVTISAAYTGDFATSANVTVWTASGTLVYVYEIFSPGLGAHAGSFIWVATTPGSYRLVETVVTPYGAPTTATESITVVAAPNPGGTTIYLNTTNYQNSSVTKSQGMFGLSPGLSSAILLVIGAVVGLIVAMLLGRMMWASGPSAAAQPWKAKGNECSICHQSFDTPEELAAHSKSAHGMG